MIGIPHRNQARSRSVEVNEITYPSKRMERPKHLEPPKAAKEQCITLIMSNFSLTYPYYSILIQNVQPFFLLFVGSSHGKCATFPGRRGAVPPAAGADARHGGVARVPAAPVPIAGRLGELASAARWGRLGEKKG